MDPREYTVAEAAKRLGVNPMTVRRWAVAKRLKARKLGRRWLLDATGVDRSSPAAAPLTAKLDFRRAVGHVLRRRRRQDWLPDALDYEDVSADRRHLLHQVERRWRDGDLEGRQLEHIPVPKDRLSFRPGAFLRLDDEVLLTAVVSNAGRQIEGSLGDNIYSYRLAASGKELLAHQGLAWGRFQATQRDAVSDGWTHVLVTDIAGFYEHVDPDVLTDTLGNLGVRSEDRGAIKGLLKGWQKKSGLRGLPQGPDASAVLSNAYLVPVDEEMASLARSNDWRYVRWSDDIRVFTKSEDSARTAAFRLSLAIRRQGLYLQGSKTRIRSAADAAADATAADLGAAGYLFSLGAMKASKELIVPIFRRATHGGRRIDPGDITELRFSLYRLGAMGDDRALRLVLRELPTIAFLGDFIYLYLRAFLGRPSVLARIADVLGTLQPDRDAYLAGQLLRLLHEAPTVTAIALDTIRSYAGPAEPTPAVRAVAVTALGKHGSAFDESQIRTALWRESDPRVVRAQLAALAVLAPLRSRATLGDFRRANPSYAGTVDFILHR